jgi:hypothetical protein
MPKALEDKLKREARAKELGKERTGAYVYGTLQKVTGWKPGKKKGALKEYMEKKGH